MTGEVGEGPRLFIDARLLHGAGIGRYLRPIVERAIEDPRFGRVVLGGDPDALREAYGAAIGRGRVIHLPWRGGPYSPRTHLEWVGRVAPRVREVDVSFFPHFDVPLGLVPGRLVLTVHDLTHFVLPDLFPAAKRMLAGGLLARAVGRADRVLTVSERTRVDLVRRHPETAPKVEVVHNGLPEAFRAAALRPATEPPVSGPYLLFVGNRKRHKNLPVGVRALAELHREHPDLRLVFAGGSARDAWPEVMRLADQLGIGDRIVDLERPTDPELIALYRGAVALLFLSFNEGFGYPALEAMALGTPVIAARAGALPEIVGSAGILVDPHGPREVVDGVRRLMTDPRLRSELSRTGVERAGTFSEDRMVRRTVDALVRACPSAPATQPSESTNR